MHCEGTTGEPVMRPLGMISKLRLEVRKGCKATQQLYLWWCLNQQSLQEVSSHP
jgi:hypothetical protein